jgi:predicted P-loop ATPase
MASESVVNIANYRHCQWFSLLKKGKDSGEPLPTLANCTVALERAPEWVGALSYNEFSRQISVKSNLEDWHAERGRPWTENDTRRLTVWFQNHGINVVPSVTSDAVALVAESQTTNPLLDFLADLHWDRWPRVERWLTYYLGVEDTYYARAVGQAWLISAIARAWQPGCKADCCLILEGPQGSLKSSAIRTLAGPELYSDSMHTDLGSKEAGILCCGAWIIELSELESLRFTEVATVKSFLSHAEDRYRPPYGRHAVRFPRQCVFCGTTNNAEYLHDDSGARRFWPVSCGRIELKQLERDREQIWAEAAELYHAGRSWWLDKETERMAAHEQMARTESDVWQTPILEWLDRQHLTDTSVAEILSKCIQIEDKNWNRTADMRVAKVLRALGWVQYRTGGGKARRYKYIPN